MINPSLVNPLVWMKRVCSIISDEESSSDSTLPSLSVVQGGPFPVSQCVTFTKQVHKKNKVFSDGLLVVESVSRVRLLNSFHVQIASCEMAANLAKLHLFHAQYKQAVIETEGFVEGVIDGVILHLDNPPLLPETCRTGGLDSKPAITVKKQPFPSLKRGEFIAPARNANQFVPANTLNNSTPTLLLAFHPISSLNQCMSLYQPVSNSTQCPSTSIAVFCLRICNQVYREIFDRVTAGSSKKSVLGESSWRIAKTADGKYFISRSEKEQWSYCSVLAIMVGASPTMLLFEPVWRGFNPNGQLEVRPISLEAFNAPMEVASSYSISVAYGITDLQASVGLVSAVRELARVCAPRRFPCKLKSFACLAGSRQWLDPDSSCLKMMLSGEGESPLADPLLVEGGEIFFLVSQIAKSLALSSEQTETLRAVASWFTGADVEFVLSDENIAVGNFQKKNPPLLLLAEGVFGSGKSTVLAACIYLCARLLEGVPISHSRILLLAGTNVAVDGILLKLRAAFGFADFARLGVLERVNEGIVGAFSGRLSKDASSKPAALSIAEWKAKRLIAATAATASDLDFSCPFVFVDEAAQLTEVAALLPLLRVRPVRILLFGDSKQLAPTSGYPSVLFAFSKFRNSRTLHLLTQFRSHSAIANVCSDLFYDGNVRSEAKVAEIPGIPPVSVLTHNFKASRGSLKSLENSMEAELMLQFLRMHAESLANRSTAIVTFYVSQANLVRELLTGCTLNVAVHTVDSFQGGEADLVLVSLTAHDAVRSRSFLSNPNRVNVALSRAKQAVVIFGHKRVFEGIDCFAKILDSYATHLEL